MNQSKKVNLAVITPSLPPAVDGIGDYTFHLIPSLALDYNLSVYIYNYHGSCSPRAQNYQTFALYSPNRSLTDELIARNIQLVVLQYAGHGYQSRGCPVRLIRSLHKWKSSSNSHRLLIMFHELWHVPANRFHLDIAIQAIHKRLLISLSRKADHIFVSTAGYRSFLYKYLPSQHIDVLPVGSNIVSRNSTPFYDRPEGNWILFGKQESRIRTLLEFAKWIPALYASNRLRILHVVGHSSSPLSTRREDELLDSFLPTDAYRKHLNLDPLRVSKIMERCRYGLFSQSPESFTKSGVLMAYCSHRLQIVVPEQWPEYIPISNYMVTPTSLICSDRQSHEPEYSSLLYQWYDKEAAWGSILRRYKSSLEYLLQL